jgi:hypothetical protein
MLAGDGTADGAVYIPVASIVPCTASPPASPFTCQATAGLAALETTALNFFVVETCTVALEGSTDIVTLCPVGLLEDWTVPHPQTINTTTSNAPMLVFFPQLPAVRESIYEFPPKQTGATFPFRRNGIASFRPLLGSRCAGWEE